MLHPANLKTAGRAGSTGCQRQAPLSSHCSLDSEGGEAAQTYSLCSETQVLCALPLPASHSMGRIHKHHRALQNEEMKHQSTASKLTFSPEGFCSSVIAAITALCKSHFPQPTLPVAPSALLATDSNSGHWLLFKSAKWTVPVTSTWHDSNTIFKIQIFNRKI